MSVLKKEEHQASMSAAVSTVEEGRAPEFSSVAVGTVWPFISSDWYVSCEGVSSHRYELIVSAFLVQCFAAARWVSLTLWRGWPIAITISW